MDGLKTYKKGLKDVMEANTDGLKEDMKGLKEGLTKFLIERLPSCDKLIHENHDEEKRNMNYGFRDSNIGFKTHHIPHRYEEV